MEAERAENEVEGCGVVGDGLVVVEDVACDLELLVKGEVGVAVEELPRGLGGDELGYAGGDGV